MEGRETEVRHCIACNQGCVGNLLGPAGRMGCVVNPGVGFERMIGDDHIGKADAAKKVLVIGGGPAGMEAARVAALRGHQVTLADATPELGGMINFAAKLPLRHGIADLTVWQESEIYRLGVDVRLSTDDGSAGHHGLVTDLLRDLLSTENQDLRVVCCGPEPMMEAVAQVAAQDSPPHLQVAVKLKRSPADEYANATQPGVQTVGEHEIYHSVFASERQGESVSILCEWKEPCPRVGEDEGHGVGVEIVSTTPLRVDGIRAERQVFVSFSPRRSRMTSGRSCDTSQRN